MSHVCRKYWKKKQRKLDEQLFTSTKGIIQAKTCHKCQHIKQDLKQTEQTWACPQCNTTHHRDINVAKNILQE